MNKKDLEKFFIRLEELLQTIGCNGSDLSNAGNILDEMNVSKEEKEEFLENCRKSGGFCDCEIFLNSEEHLREIYSK